MTSGTRIGLQTPNWLGNGFVIKTNWLEPQISHFQPQIGHDHPFFVYEARGLKKPKCYYNFTFLRSKPAISVYCITNAGLLLGIDSYKVIYASWTIRC